MSRFDSIGIFWRDELQKRGKRARMRIMPPIPDTGWKPRPYPNLNAAKVLAVDIEAKDPEIDDHGPGWARHRGHICGFSVGTEDGFRQYFPIRHEIEPGDNLVPEHALAWLRDTLRYRPDGHRPRPIVGANLIYDAGWLAEEDVIPLSELRDYEFIDVQFAEALLDQRAFVALEVLGQKYLGRGKTSELIEKWCREFYGTSAEKWRRDIYRTPPRLAGPYGEGDADIPLCVIPKQYELLRREGLHDLFMLECGLIPLLVEMRFAGVSVHLKRAEQLRTELAKRMEAEQKNLNSIVGWQCKPTSSQQLAKAFDQFGLRYPMTAPTKKHPNGQASFENDFLKELKHPVAQTAYQYRRLKKLNGTFVEGYVLNGNIDSKIFCSFHPLKGEFGGTAVGRFSSSDPNLQNIPIRDKELGKIIRSLFVPDAGHRRWVKFDYSQIQYRVMVNYAVGPGAEEARQKYINDPNTDYHAMVQAMVEAFTGRKWDRRPVKNLNFGLSFGMGNEKAGLSTGLEGKELEAFLDAYHKAAPYAKKTMEYLMDFAQKNGYIRTVLNRKARFDMWEPAKWGTGLPPLPYDRAIREYGRVRRAKLHKALACLLQGCEGDIMKAAMLRAYREGVFRYIGVPRLIVHDEFDFSDAGDQPQDAWDYFQHDILENTVRLKIPIKADVEIGDDWGTVREVKKAA